MTTVIFTSAARATETQIIIPSNQAIVCFIILFLFADGEGGPFPRQTFDSGATALWAAAKKSPVLAFAGV
jgi:hypothetical protein